MKTVFITGINSGLGKALFDQFVQQDYFVYGLLRNEEEHQKIAASLPENAALILADISADAAISVIQRVVGNKSIDLLINNAGVGGCASKLEEVLTAEILHVFNINCVGTLRVAKALHKNLLDASDAMIININSRLGSITRQANGTYQQLTVSYAYRISKAAQNMLTACLRAEFDERIQIISMHPGTLKTDIAQPGAMLEPSVSAKQIIDTWESGRLKEENGIIELPDSVIEW